MVDLYRQLANLSPEKLRLLETWLKEQGIDPVRSIIMPQPRTQNTFPLSFAQQRLWFLDQLEPGHATYNIPTVARLTGVLDANALARALNEIVRRHESLRTTFAVANGQPVQVITWTMSVELPIDDLSAVPERQAEALRRANDEAQQPFDLARGPLFRVRLLRLADDEHIVLLTMHHIIADGWSMNVMMQELAALYAAFTTGTPASLSELPIQYADYACWQQRYLSGETRQDQIAFWKQQLDGIPTKLELPTDRPRSPVQSYRGAAYLFDLPKPLIESLRSLSQRENATLFMTLLAAFQILLHRYSGQDDICVGTPIANRNRAEIENLIGFFVNTLVLRGNLNGDPSFRELLKWVRETTLNAYAHQDLPFEMLVDELHPQRDESYAPLFQVMFALQTIPNTTFHLPSITITSLPVHSGTTKFDLTFALSEDGNNVGGLIEYSTDLFDEATIARMAGHYRTLLEGIAANLDLPIAQYALLTPAERHQLVVAWNDTAVKFPCDVCIHQMFEQHAERTPDALAVVCEESSLTYHELNRRANQLAHHLRARGVGPDVLVGVCCDRSVEMIVGVLGVLKAGGAYVPLDPAYPTERLAFILQDTRAPVLLTQAHLTRSTFILPDSCQVICLDADWQAIAQDADDNLDGAVTSQNLAYVIYTSGSTGTPKGVCCQHRGVINNLSEFQQRVPLASEDVCSWWTSLNFDVSVYEIFSPLIAGGTLSIVPETVRAEGKKFIEWLSAHKIKSAYVPPFMVADLDIWTQHEPATLALKRLLVGVEPIKEQVLAAIQTRLPALCILNGYGPTEATICCTLYPISSKRAPDRNTPIGKPMWNTQIYLLDAHLQPVPIGVPCELYIGGEGLARGYWNRPELTAEKFIYHPDFSRLYRTGDLARYLPDGNIMFIGRTDFQVKLRGYRVELGEIEEILRQHPNLREVLVLVRDDLPSGKCLVAYATPRHAPPPTVGELRAFLKDRLPEYMLPSAYVLLESFPITPNGKIDRRALPVPELITDEHIYVAPRNPTEELLAGLWSQILAVPRVGVHDNFFDLGGHSLLATQLIARIRETFGIDLPLRALFQAPTIAALATQVDAAQRVSLPPIPRIARDAPLPLSFAQQRLWFLDQLEPNSAVYNIAATVRLTGHLDVAAFERAVNEIIRRHEILRTMFAMTDGQPCQVIAPDLTLTVPVSDARDEAEALSLATVQAQHPFDLARGPLLRVQLVRVCENTHFVLWTMHHSISDGWSSGVLLHELAALYAAFSADQPSPLPDLAIQYADYAAWQRAWLSGAILDEQLAFWKKQLAHAPTALDLPTDHPRPAVQTNRGAHQSFALAPDLIEKMIALSRAEQATAFMIFLAAFQTLLLRYTHQDDLCIGTPIANRNRAELENLIGMFVNTLVLRADLSGDPTFRDLLKRVRAITLDAYAHQDVPFEMVVNAVQPERDLRYTPLFQVMFTFQNVANQTITLPGLEFEHLDIESGLAMFDLTLTLTETTAGLLGNLEYNTDLFDATTIARMIGHWQTLLAGIVANPDQPISALPMLTEAEHQQFAAWNNTAIDLPQARDSCLHHIFEAQAARTPDAIAVRCAGQALTYRELNQRANQLAHHLQDLGVQPDTLVGLATDRSLAMVVSLLGILKAGGAYLPLDPAYPTERLVWMLNDSDAALVLTQSPLASRFQGSARTLCLDTEWNSIVNASDTNPISSATPQHLAYVIYTSGSTGQPKGVMVEHRSVVNHNFATARAFGLTPRDRVLQFATINFDAAVEEIFPAWLVGATVIMRPEGAIPSGAEITRWIETEQITVLDLPTAYWHTWVYEMTLSQTRVPPGVHLLVLGGEKASAERMAQWQKQGGAEIRWLNTYGPTEGTIIATLYDPASDAESLTGREIPIGKPIANTQIQLLDPHGQRVPIGVTGEIYLGGVGVARGYWDRPDLTVEKFIHPPTFGRLYRTGDLARYRADGNIEFLGRSDDQVKVRGFRIELGEIEAMLELHPAVQQAVVLARAENEVNRLVAYVAVSADGQPALSRVELREFLHAKLPEYMVPSAFVVLDALPQLPSGKVDRRALPAPEATAIESKTEFAAPSTPTEEILAKIWADILGVSHVGIHDNFFELGGDSILSIQVIARAQQAGLMLTPKQLFQAPTIAKLAHEASISHATRIHAEQGRVTGDTPLTPIQRWFFEQNLVEPHHWNQALLVKAHEPLQRVSLEHALAVVLAHHDALQSRFSHDESGWHATNVVDGQVPLEWIDLRGEPTPARAIETLAAELQASLNLAEGPLLRAAYFDLGTEHSGRLLLIAHHLVVDGVSWRILLEDLLTAYQQASRSERVELPAKTTSFQYWARRLQTYAQSEAMRNEWTYWRDILQPNIASLPVDANGANDEASAQSVTMALEVQETLALVRDVPTAYHTEINEVLLTALAQALARWTGMRTVLVDVEGHGREDLFDEVDVSRTVGWFTTVYPVCLEVSATNVGAVLKSIKEQLRQVPQHGIGYGLLRYLNTDARVAEQIRTLPQAQVSFNYLGQLDQSLAATQLIDFAPESSGVAHGPRNARSHLIDINGGVAQGQLRFEWTYSANCHQHVTIQHLAEQFVQVLRAIIQDCQKSRASNFTPSDFPLAQLDQRQLDKVLTRVGRARERAMQ